MDYSSYINHHHQTSSFDPQSFAGSLGVGVTGSMDTALSNYADLSACAQVNLLIELLIQNKKLRWKEKALTLS